MTYNHVHGYIRIRLRWLFLALGLLHLPNGWLVQSGTLPHHPECTPDEGIIDAEIGD